MNSLYDYFDKMIDKNKISHSFLIGNVKFDDVKNDLYKICLSYTFYEIIFLSSHALDIIIGSRYSMSPPIGIPYDNLDTLTLYFSNIFWMYNDVTSPSIDGFNAIIISFTSSLILFFIKLSIFIHLW